MLFILIALLITLALVIGLHELGHALAAKFAKVRIQCVSIGFGKPLISWKKNNTLWCLARWPLGGYVKLLNSRIQDVDLKDYPFCFDKKPFYWRLIILLAGAFMNIVVAFVALNVFFMQGYSQYAPIVKQVTSKGLAEQIGMQNQDRILQLAGEKINSWQDFSMQILMHLGQNNISLQIENAQKKTKTLILNLQSLRLTNKGLFTQLGIIPEKQEEKIKGLALKEASLQALHKIKTLSVFYLVLMKQLLQGHIAFSSLLGPLSFFSLSANALNQGLNTFLYFIACLSITVALVNLLPIPSLDGGSIIYALIEKIRGKPVSIGMEVLFHRLALIVFCLLLFQLLMNDLSHFK